MKDLGLVQVWGNGIDLGGPVAILLETPTHFVGGIIEDKNGEKLVLHLLPKSSIAQHTAWQRSAPYSERLLRHVAMLDCVAGKGQGHGESEAIRVEEETTPQRVYGKHGAYLPLPPIPSGKSRKPGTNSEVAAVKADLGNLMDKYKQIVPDGDKKEKKG